MDNNKSILCLLVLKTADSCCVKRSPVILAAARSLRRDLVVLVCISPSVSPFKTTQLRAAAAERSVSGELGCPLFILHRNTEHLKDTNECSRRPSLLFSHHDDERVHHLLLQVLQVFRILLWDVTKRVDIKARLVPAATQRLGLLANMEQVQPC